jgi:hypothetical protein
MRKLRLKDVKQLRYKASKEKRRKKDLKLAILFILAVLGFELRALLLIGRHFVA